MDEERPTEHQVASESADDEYGLRSEQHISAFFSHSKHFSVTGGNFTMINEAAPEDPSGNSNTKDGRNSPPDVDFRTIPFGDINLLLELKQYGRSGVVHHRKRRAPTRRMYTVWIPGLQSVMTAAVFQGESAEKQWRAAISQYLDVRHHNLLQLYGIASTGRLHAVVFHDDLVALWDFWGQYEQSHFSGVFFFACIQAHLHEACQYILSTCGLEPHWNDYTAWIRPSTRVLSIELIPPESRTTALLYLPRNFQSFTGSLLTPPPISAIIDSISLVDYHRLCSWYLCSTVTFTPPTEMAVGLASVGYLPGIEYEPSLEVSFSPNFTLIDQGWSTENPIIKGCWDTIASAEGTSILEDGWIRVKSACVAERYKRRIYSDDVCRESWLAQANHIFDSLDVRSNLEDYVFVHIIDYFLQLLGPIENLHPGYLMLCPLAELETDVPGWFRVPDCPAYWSVDPSGEERLSAEEARTRGFPDIDSWTEVRGGYWDGSVYEGIRQFYEAKGFDPDSQDVAIELGYTLFESSCERDDPVTHLQEIDTDYHDSESDGMSGGEDCESIGANVEDAFDAEIASESDVEMSDGNLDFQDMEMVEDRSLVDLDADNAVHQEATIAFSDEDFAMLCD